MQSTLLTISATVVPQSNLVDQFLRKIVSIAEKSISEGLVVPAVLVTAHSMIEWSWTVIERNPIKLVA